MGLVEKILNKFIKLFGFEIKAKYKTVKPEENQKTLNTNCIFNFFSTRWISKFIIDGETFGGENDYSSLRISMLNLPELGSYVNFDNKRILELGPLEGGNTILLEKFAPKEIVSIEGRLESYIKCCVVKNLYSLNKAQFFLDDARTIIKEKYGVFDVAVVLGLLYHLDNPLSLLKSLGTLSSILVLSTHYADSSSPYVNAENSFIEENGKQYKGRIYIENPESDPNAGLQIKSFWPYERDLLEMIKDAGFWDINVLAKNPVKDEKYKLIYLIAKK